ncbi:phospholipase D-like domain-containing protein [Dictyobacter arantiisoli]|uniref:Phospholipase n=1 Tax=Dictyobacter arantiisoli TaxID=2014874 RepID=A0A5A5T928_9CHLR|nr:phospholipase D family protein [Dictyobacter arantiisoli]GCF07775.1 phospholipase [Dictyobacter arantiisoli]
MGTRGENKEFSEPSEAQMTQWWAAGDTPVRTHSEVTYFVDGRAALLEMCRQFVKAKQTIYLANWGMEPDMLLVRGKDALPDSSTPWKRSVLSESLRAEGFQDVDIEFWLNHPLSVKEVLRYAVNKGVEVKVLLWKAKKAFAVYDSQAAYEKLTEAGITCLLDDSAEGILHHQIESLHQKVTIVDHTYAFVGGVDPLIEKEDDFDRWDTPEHPFTTSLRLTSSGTTPHAWHDVHARIHGPAAGDVELNFRQRWNDMVHRHHLEKHLSVPEHPLPEPVESKSIVQIARTVPQHTYSFDKNAILGITQLYQSALQQAQHSIYLENQYFWQRAYYGVDVPFVGKDSKEMEIHIGQIITALRRGACASLILPDHPNVGRAFSDASITTVREAVPQAVQEGRFQVFTLATSHFQEDDGLNHYRPIYVHAKVAIIDDHWSTVGSANLNNRGMHDDTEINVATLDADLAYGLRLLLQGEHLGLLAHEDLENAHLLFQRTHLNMLERRKAQKAFDQLEEALEDPLQALKLMQQRAAENLQRYKTHHPLLGHLLPYLTAGEATEQGLPFQEEHGWLEEAANK